MILPKYSDRVNFFLVIFSKDVPMRKGFGTILDKLQSKISSTKDNRMLLHTLTEAASTERISNKSRLPEISLDHEILQKLRKVFQHFFHIAGKVLDDKGGSKAQKINDLLALLMSTVTVINTLVHHLDNAWVPKYGSISAEYLEYTTPLEFLEVIPIGHKILGKDFKIGLEKLKMEAVPIRAYYYELVKKSELTLLHF